MNRLDWHSFASRETIAHDSDFDLTADPARDASSVQLLDQPHEAVNHRGDYQRDTHSFQPYVSDGLKDPGGDTLHSQSIRNKYHDLDYSIPKNVQATTDSSTRVHWKGNPRYHLTWEIIGVLVSVCFLILGGFVANLEAKPQSSWSTRIIQATQIAPSLWPILFSGVLGNAIRAFADWRVERGIPLLALEQLMGSLTLASSLITVFRWSIFRLSSIALILLWAFNPLGSQASFRGVYLQALKGSGAGQITYYNYNLSSQLGLTMYKGGSTRSRPTVRALYSAVLYDVIASTQYVNRTNATYEGNIVTLGGHQASGVQAAMDSWGNLRIPNLEYLANYDAQNPYRWLNTPWMESVQNYSSLIGDRVDGINRNFTGNTTFNVSSSYQNFNCSPWMKFNSSAEAEPWFLATLGTNMSSIVLPSNRAANFPRTFFVASTHKRVANSSTVGHPGIIFGTRGVSVFLSVTACSTRTTYVDAQVFCMSRGTLGKANCGVNSVRKTLLATDPEDLTLLEAGRVNYPNTTINHDPGIPTIFLNAFMDMLDDVQTGSGTSSIVEWYIKDPLSAFNNPGLITLAELGDLHIELFEQRFALLWNTLWKISLEYKSVLGGPMTTSPSYDTLINTTSTTTFHLPPVYAIDRPWIVLYFFAVAIMFFAAVFSLVMHYRCQAPSILGFVSSLIRDSTYFGDNGVQGNSIEDGVKKTKRLGDLGVMVADIKTESEVGKMAFVPLQTGMRVRKQRFYE
ncbi:uncharacterized protein K460DRAFT_406484 [Cucurbitaria berberidis CBS 394.84]|uniref:Uncharacterized protein n=1 Tax=Cucurbitaria berberidis CBS 394.84 TaxID=1168544 RepID=A0A9P4GHJ5_9PLEO|nr:uncharacterized protein K460DRAFT_406484 [Cucurbitaria berberidis CBS 394.84]KAF1846268.1 hypothetical protein K460DRAFT_406484 [Cucurbitaria berberidis CBS 394.84]